ncbi:ParA family protein [Haematomicrobium sanguinis]|uniref:ParA family protein n=1 Tax=Haematomicrobium sanguinis TaxID=479106 RepID=UPI00068ABE15|nr:ParA family protein [Haematomicrobium sanguinis]
MQVVSISSLKGGVGKTSVTLGLASAALNAGLNTLVIDLDPHADATTGLDVRAQTGRAGSRMDIGRMLRYPKRYLLSDNVAHSGWTTRVDSNGMDRHTPLLDVAQGSAFSGIYDRPDISKRDLKRLPLLLSKVRGYDLVLIDCPPSLNGLTRMAWVASNRVLLVAEPQLFSVAGTERTMRAMQMLREEVPHLSVTTSIVANRVRPESTEHTFRLSEIRGMFGDQLLSPVLDEVPNWQQIQGAAHAVHQWPEDNARATAKRFDELLAQIVSLPARPAESKDETSTGATTRRQALHRN